MACTGNLDILILDEPTTWLNLISWRQVVMGIFIGYQKSYVAFVSLSLSLSLFFLCVVLGVGGDRESEARP